MQHINIQWKSRKTVPLSLGHQTFTVSTNAEIMCVYKSLFLFWGFLTAAFVIWIMLASCCIRHSWGWRDDSIVKSIWFFPRGLEFTVPTSGAVAYNNSSNESNLLAFMGASRIHVHCRNSPRGIKVRFNWGWLVLSLLLDYNITCSPYIMGGSYGTLF